MGKPFRRKPAAVLPDTPQVFRRTVLPSGVRVVSEEIPGSRSVALGVWVRTGSRAEKAAQGGAAHFIEHLLFKGTPSRSAAALAREIDAIGGHLDAFTSREYTCYYLNVLVEHLERGMEILSDILLNSLFPSQEVERERMVILEEIKMSEDNPEDSVYELLVQNIWPGNALGRPILGRNGTIGSLSRDELVAFFRGHYRASNLVFAAAGGIEHHSLEGLWKKFFPVPPGRPVRTRPSRPRFRGGFYGRPRELEQTHLCFAAPGLSQTDPRRFGLHVLNSLFGGSMSSRLFQEIREKRGWAYSIFSSHSAFRDTGLFTVSVGTSPDLAHRVVGLIDREMARIAGRTPSAAEVARAKDHLKGNVILGLESNSSRMMSLARQEIYFRRQFGIDETIRGVEAVTAGEVHDLARCLFVPSSAAWAAVGPEASIKKISQGRR